MSGIIPARESLTVAFKRDRKDLSDGEIVAAVACLANADGGELYIGVEDDGTVSGISARRVDPARLTALIASRTRPSLSVRTETLQVEGVSVVWVEVYRSR